ncbi:hypothetical protein FO519_008685 [Halicephalobus sp. NKZ332]|nr:hypothetical protein FO519_008685 [Halicephalobus sp. NKZ332]
MKNSNVAAMLQNPGLQIPTSNSNFLEKVLAGQTMDPLSYLAALLPNGISFQNPTVTASVPPHLTAFYANDRNNIARGNVTKRRNRTTFTHDQAAALEKEYSMDQYMPRSRRAVVADSLNLTESQVKTWFQNRRAKDKRTDKLNGIQNSNLLSAQDENPRSCSQNSQKQTTPTFDTNFLMPPVSSHIRPTPSPSSSAASSTHSPISPLSPLINGPVNFLANFNSSANLNSATLTAFYMQALQLQNSLASSPSS